MQELAGTYGVGVRDVFDYPDAEPSELFINPFSCAIDPFMWRELQVHRIDRHAHAVVLKLCTTDPTERKLQDATMRLFWKLPQSL